MKLKPSHFIASLPLAALLLTVTNTPQLSVMAQQESQGNDSAPAKVGEVGDVDNLVFGFSDVFGG